MCVHVCVPVCVCVCVVVKILEVGGREEGRPCCVLGTVYKDQKLKPSILDEYTKVHTHARARTHTRYVPSHI